jgi:hypothetical protein
MNLQTKVKIPSPNFEIIHQDKLMSIGSCFAHNMAQQFGNCKFNIVNNPFGILYNPLSIAKGLEEILGQKKYTAEDLFFHNERWNSFNHHSEFSKNEQSKTLKLINQSIEKAHLQLLNSKVLIITLGTANVFFKKENNEFVANCHKIPNYQFEKKIISIEKIVTHLKSIFIKIKAANPNLQIILTLSPIRHIRDGLIENQRSKAILLLAINQLMQELIDLYYFPSYEIALDELRDYRFYNADMIHLSDIALEYIWEQFGNTFFSTNTKQLNKQFKKLQKALAHRPFNTASEQHQAFLKKQEQLIQTYQKQYPYLDFSKETMNIQAALI